MPKPRPFSLCSPYLTGFSRSRQGQTTHFHDFFQLAIEAFPEEWSKVVPFSNATPHILLLRLFEPFDPQIWEGIRQMTPFHKLTYKFSQEDAETAGTYYRALIVPAQQGGQHG